VDDPRTFGRVAAANALNDVFAMGGRPLLALSITAFPEELPTESLAAVLAVQGRNEAREQRNEAVAQERSSRSRELAANALLNLAADPSLSLLLAIEAAETEPTPEAENALRQALLEPQPAAVLAGHDDSVGEVALSADGTLVATSSADGTARVWDAATGEPLAVLRGHRRDVSGVELAPDGGRILTWAQDGTARIWDARRGTPVRTLRDDPDESGRMTDATFGAGGGLVATASFLGGYVAVWDAATGRRISTLELAGESVVDDVDFTPDGERAVGVLQDGTTQLWEVRTGRTLAVLAGHETYVWAVDVSRDGRLLAYQVSDGGSDWTTLRVRDVATGEDLDDELTRFHQEVERFRLDGRVAVGQRPHEHDLRTRARYP